MRPKNFPRISLIAFFFLLLQTQLSFPEEKLTITHGPYLIDPGENAITVIWLTNKKCVSRVEYCGDSNFGTFPTWGGYPEMVQNSHHGLIDANTTVHVVRITGLKPGTVYRYRVVSKEILQFKPYEVLFGDSVVSDVLQFNTLSSAKSNFSFGVVTDIHEQAEILDTLLQIIPTDSLELMFFSGDILNWLNNEEQIFESFLDVSIKRFAKEKPFIYLRGNHETRGHFARSFPKYFPHHTGKFYYSFNQGNVHFIILDSGEDKPDSHPVYASLVDFDTYREEQAQWLKSDIQSEKFRQAKYRIVFSHIPLFSGSTNHGASDITKKWGPILNDANIDLLFSGHTHRYSYIKPTAGKNNFHILILGKNQAVKTDVSEEKLALSVKTKNGELVELISIRHRN